MKKFILLIFACIVPSVSLYSMEKPKQAIVVKKKEEESKDSAKGFKLVEHPFSYEKKIKDEKQSNNDEKKNEDNEKKEAKGEGTETTFLKLQKLLGKDSFTLEEEKIKTAKALVGLLQLEHQNDSYKKTALAQLSETIALYKEGNITHQDVYNVSKFITGVATPQIQAIIVDLKAKKTSLELSDQEIAAKIKELQAQRDKITTEKQLLSVDYNFFEKFDELFYPNFKLKNKQHLTTKKEEHEKALQTIDGDIQIIEKETVDYKSQNIQGTVKYTSEVDAFNKKLIDKQKEKEANRQELADLEQSLTKIDQPGTWVGNLRRAYGF